MKNINSVHQNNKEYLPLGNFDLSKEVYIAQEVFYAIKNKWNPLLFPDENHVFLELIKDNYIYRVTTSGPILLEHIRNGSILENKDSDFIRSIVLNNKSHEYKVKIKNSIVFEMLQIKSKIDDEKVIAETILIKDDFFPGTTMPFVISNFLKNVQKAHYLITKK